ncbi:MAG TPA: NADH-quinone oxidoreductase subunit NuoI, partial [Actinotalea sp.]
LSAPHPMVPGTEDTDYYRGEVNGPVPEQVDWVAQWRPEDPSLAALRPAGRSVATGSAAAQDEAAR